MRAKFGGNNLAKKKLRDVQQSFDESLAELMDSVNKTGKMTEAGNGKGKKAKAEEPAIIPGKRRRSESITYSTRISQLTSPSWKKVQSSSTDLHTGKSTSGLCSRHAVPAG